MEPAKLIIIDGKLISDSATVTASTATGEFPASNLQDTRLDKAWRATGDSSEWVKFDLGEARAINAFAMTGFNFTQDATIKIEASATGTFTGEQVEILATTSIYESIYGYGEGGFGEHGYGGYYTDEDGGDWDAVYWVVFDDANYRYWKITLVDAANPDTYIQVARMIVSQALYPGDYKWQYKITPVDPSNVIFTSGASARSKTLKKYHQIDLMLAQIYLEDYYATILPIWERNGITSDLVVVMDGRDVSLRPPYAARQVYYARFTARPELTADILSDVPLSFRQNR